MEQKTFAYSTVLSRSRAERLDSLIAIYANWPKPGITFRDVMPALTDAAMFSDCVAAMAEPWSVSPQPMEWPTKIVGIESRGFILGAAMAKFMGLGFVAARKAKDRPWNTHTDAYSLEYGDAVLEIPIDALGPKDRVVIVDDLIALGGTACSAVRLVRKTGAYVVGVSTMVEIAPLGGRAALHALNVRLDSLLTY